MKNKIKYKVSLFIALIIGFVYFFTPSFMANTDLDIVSETNITVKAAQDWAKSRGASNTFISLAEKYWSLSKEHGNVNPAIAYAQAAIETNFGKFTGKVTEDYCNPCGMKTSDGTLFNKFDSWDDGISAQLDHLALYAGAEGYPRENTKDTRHFKYLLGSSKTLSTLGESWAESKEYGDSICNLYEDMKKYIKEDIIKISSDSRISKDNQKISGYIYSQNSITSVKILVDNTQVCCLSKLWETKSNKGYEDYLNKDAYFTYNLDYNKYPGKHKVEVKVIHSYGKDSSYSYSINVTADSKEDEVENTPADKNLGTIMYVDFPRESSEFNGSSLKVSGWALSGQGISKLEVYLDGELITTTKTGNSRPDVNKVYPQYKDSNSGFNVSINLNGYLETRELEVVAYGVNGSKSSVTKKFTFKALPSYMIIDEPSVPSVSTSNTKVLKIRGWALSSKKVKSIDVLIDGNRFCSVDYGKARPDVNRVYPQYKNNNAGFEGAIELDNIIGGTRKISVRVNHTDGSSFVATKTIKIEKKASLMCVDEPSNNYKITNNVMTVRGWALADSGVQDVKVYINNVLKGTAVYGASRPDVNKVYPGYSVGDKSGFSLTFNVSNLKDGTHKIKVITTAKDGSQDSITKTVTKGNVKKKLIVVDAGHGGYDSGAPSYFNGKTYLEKDICLSIAYKLKSKLEAKGYEVVMTRTNDTFVDLVPRSNKANNLNADFFVSIHQDSFDNPSANGSTVFYTTKVPDKGYWAKDKNYKFRKSQEAARKIVDNICSSIGTYNRGVIDRSLSVTRNTDMPSVLVECGFISNYHDCMIISSNSGQEKIATAITNAIVSTF